LKNGFVAAQKSFSLLVILGVNIAQRVKFHKSIRDLWKSTLSCHSGGSRAPEHLENTGSRLPPEWR